MSFPYLIDRSSGSDRIVKIDDIFDSFQIFLQENHYPDKLYDDFLESILNSLKNSFYEIRKREIVLFYVNNSEFYEYSKNQDDEEIIIDLENKEHEIYLNDFINQFKRFIDDDSQNFPLIDKHFFFTCKWFSLSYIPIKDIEDNDVKSFNFFYYIHPNIQDHFSFIQNNPIYMCYCPVGLLPLLNLQLVQLYQFYSFRELIFDKQKDIFCQIVDFLFVLLIDYNKNARDFVKKILLRPNYNQKELISEILNYNIPERSKRTNNEGFLANCNWFQLNEIFWIFIELYIITIEDSFNKALIKSENKLEFLASLQKLKDIWSNRPKDIKKLIESRNKYSHLVPIIQHYCPIEIVNVNYEYILNQNFFRESMEIIIDLNIIPRIILNILTSGFMQLKNFKIEFLNHLIDKIKKVI